MKKIGFELKWALLFAVMQLLWMLFEKSMGWHDERIGQHAVYTNLVAIPAIALYVVALLDIRKNKFGGRMSWKQGFMSGALISVIVSALSPLVLWITMEYITPHFFENAVRYAVSNGKSTQAEAEAYFNLRNYTIQGLIGSLAMGLVTSALVALFVRKK